MEVRQVRQPVRVTGATVAVAVVVMLAGCSDGRGFPTLDDALDHQPAGLVQPGDAFTIGDAEQPCGFPRHTELVLLDATTGAVRWTRDIPWSPDPPSVIDGTVLAVGRTIDGNPPSVTATDLVSGTPRWQRFFASKSLSVAARPPEVVVVASDDGFDALDAAGSLIEVADEDTAAALGLDDDEPVASEGDQIVRLESSGVVVSVGPSAPRWRSEPVVAGDFDVSAAVYIGGDSVVALAGSSIGPNRRLVVLDRSTGAVRWSLDGVRDAAIVGDLLLWDARTGSGDQVPTRTVHVVDAGTGDERWAAATGLPLGGFVGARDDGGLVFAGTDATGTRRVVVVADAASAPRSLFNRGDVERSLVADDVIALATQTTVDAFDPAGRPTWAARTERPVQSLVATPAGVLVSAGDADFGCA